MFAFPTPPPLSLYVHLPWCVRKCPYCDFNSHEIGNKNTGGALPEADYVDALLRDLTHDLPHVWGRRVETVYFGGGTPSLFSPAAIEHLLAGIRTLLPLAPSCEITLEANPGVAEYGRFADFRAAGINRVSLGIQSFDDKKLRALGRIHGGKEALAAAAAAAELFDNFNLDLMFGLPGQDQDAARADLATALTFNPPHLSLYQLTLEPNTAFYRQPPVLPGEDAIATMQDALQARLAEAGLGQYEVSAYAREGHASRHNLNYWRFGDYLGIGAGAHGKLTRHDGIVRLAKTRQPKRYMETAGTDAAIDEQRTLTPDDAVFEFMLNALRLHEGFEPALFTARTGLSLAAAEPALTRAQGQGLVERDVHRIRPTAHGRRYLNDTIALFLPTAPQPA